MSEPEVKFEIDEHGRIGYRVTNEGVLLSKDEKGVIIDHITRMQAENAKLRDSLKALMMGTYAELCADRGESQCRECAMRRGDESCVIADAMELLGIDMYGEPLGGGRC